MSNLSNFFGESDMTLGPAKIIYDPIIFTGDTGLELDLGGTQGLSINKAIEKADLTKDQYGTSPANRVVTGQSMMLTMSLVEITLERLEAVMQGFKHYQNTGGSTVGFSWENSLSERDSAIEKPIKLILTEAGADTTDPDKIIYVPNCAPSIDTEITYDADTQRVITLEFNCYRRPKYISSVTGRELFYFSQSMLDNGLVTIGTGT